ncbi:putative alpha-13-mannosyltransferase MNN14 [Spathaspora sp. JA1]|nr:putative alpha-13-mannosyltransferase MNN14 [Spathaspora sp. JA1]
MTSSTFRGIRRVPRHILRILFFSIILITVLAWLQTTSPLSNTIGKKQGYHRLLPSRHRNPISTEEFKKLINTKYVKDNRIKYASIYKDLLQLNSNDDEVATGNLFYILENLDYQDRCKLYFSSVYDQDLIIEPTRHIDFTKLPSFQQFEKDAIDALQRESEKRSEGKREPTIKISKEMSQQIKNDYEALRRKVANEEQILHDYMNHVKVFNKCFLEEFNTTVIQDQKQLLRGFKYDSSKPSIPMRNDMSLTKLEAKVFPWLSQKSPLYESNGVEYTILDKFQGSFLKNFQKKLSGKGIVLTISDDFSEECIRLIHLLRFLKNKLPIEIVHTQEDLSQEIKNQIKKASTDPFHKYPKQSVTFVNITPAIKPEYLHKFGGFANKIVAVMFSSFAEVMLVDADTVLAKAPETFFKLRKYRSSGTLFYRDRAVPELRTGNDMRFFIKLMNTQIDDILFDLKPPTSKIFNLPFFKLNLNHMMESGLVLINRNKHYGQPLLMSNMNFFLPVISRLYGDKEMFWMSLAISGDENFEFNSLPAAAIGEITPHQEREKDIGRKGIFKSREVCSNHPAHINDEDNHSLLWFNSGFKFCSKNSKVNFELDFSRKKRYTKFKNLDEFKTFFESKMIIKAAVVPPAEVIKVPDGEGIDGEPGTGWVSLSDYCSGYTWCAYSSVGKARELKGEVGTVIEYSSEEVEYFKALGDVWMGEFDYRSKQQKESDKQVIDLQKKDM